MTKKLTLVFIAFFLCLSANKLFAEKNLDLENKILFVKNSKDGGSYLCAIDPDGSNSQRLTPTLFNIILPRNNKVTGDIAFTNMTETMKSEIYILDKTGEHLRKILTNATFHDFSPDGKKILYSTTKNQITSLYIYDMNKKEATKTSANLDICSANWSPDGEWIVVSARTKDRSMDMYLISCYGQGILPFSDTPKINEAFPIFSSDNKNIIYYTNKNTPSYEIEMLGLGLNNEGRFSYNTPNVQGRNPSFSPDSKQMVYQDNDNNIIVCDINGKNKKTIAKGMTPFWAR